MKNNETGEFELVLGNRQLLSGFFIVVVLFGVFFTMGYIVGRHSAPPPLSASAASGTEPTTSQGRPAAPPDAGRPASAPAEEKKSETPPPDAASPVETRPATA